MKSNKVIFTVFSVMVFLLASGFTFFSYELANEPPANFFNKEIHDVLVDDDTPVTIRDEKGNPIWLGTAQEYNILVKEDKFFIVNVYNAYKRGPEYLKKKLNQIEQTLNEKLPNRVSNKTTD